MGDNNVEKALAVLNKAMVDGAYTFSTEVKNRIISESRKLINEHDKIFLCGFTPLAKHFACIFAGQGKDVFFVDEQENSSFWEGIQIVSYANLIDIPHDDGLFVVCSRTIMDQHIRKIPLGCKKVSWHNVCVDGGAYDFSRYDFTQHKLFSQIDDIAENAKNYHEMLFEGLWDNTSKELLAKILLFRVSFLLDLNLNVGTKSNHYFDDDVVTLSDQEVFIDAGGYIGDTLELFLRLTKNKFKEYHLFEPEVSLFMEARNVTRDRRVKYHNFGLYDKSTKASFKVGSDGSGAVSSEGEIEIELKPLDSLGIEGVTFVKMDIEGAEMDALKGCERTINDVHPKLAICVYHKTADIRNIYNWIRAQCNGSYRIYLRAEKDNLDQQIVMYAI